METAVSQTSTLDLILKAGPIVQMVMLLLVAASVFCWAIVLSKYKLFKLASRQDTQFLNIFWSSKSLDDIFGKSEEFQFSPIAAVFKAGFKELQKLSSSGSKSDGGAREVENINRALLRSSNSEIAAMERYVSWLASTASAAPFIGLFGTVWGIMNSFHKIGLTNSVSLATVAPGISEALIATAFGLAAAIPAAIAYNHFVNKIRRIATNIESFSQDFLNIVQRGLMTGVRK